MPVVSKKQEKFMQAVANNPKFAKKVGVKQSIGREFTKEKGMKTKKMNMGGMADREGRAMAAGRLAGRPGMMADARGRAMMKKGGKVKKMRAGGNTSRTNEIEELGRLDSYGKRGKNLKDEKARVVREIKNKKAGGKVGYKAGGKVKKMGSGGLTSMGMGALAGKAMKAMGGSKAAPVAEDPKKMKKRMKDKEGRAMAAGKFKDMPGKMKDARGRAMKKGGAVMKAKGKKMMNGGKVKAYKKGGAVSSASKRADGIAQRGHTRGRHV